MYLTVIWGGFLIRLRFHFSIFFIILSFSLTGLASDTNYMFGWSHLDDTELKIPRGGTSSGPDVQFDDEKSEYWIKLQEKKGSSFEKDKLAILAMQGEFKANFDFMETMGFVSNYKPQKPYQSWGTEFVIAIEEKEDFISLQHIMVMFFEQEDGTISKPVVMKHWRQDWKYEDDKLNSYIGNNTWAENHLSFNQRKGTWSQSVYQVDDSPRYQAYGKWTHYKNFSSWTSKETWRVLPRRETTIRNDYDLIIGTNIHTITPDGWVHEQNNKKVILGEQKLVLAKEIGLARYQRIRDFDWRAGKIFWKNTNIFWQEVRKKWQERLSSSKKVTIIQEVKGRYLFMKFFQLARSYENGDKKAIDKINNVISEHTRIK
jgi:hypothetical protein